MPSRLHRRSDSRTRSWSASLSSAISAGSSSCLVRDDQRHRARLPRANVQEVHALAVDGGGELRELVETLLVGAPVVAVAPVVGQLADVAERRAVRPADARK